METSSDDCYDWNDWTQFQDAKFYFDESHIKMSENGELSTTLFMEEVQLYECTYNKFNKP